MKTKASRLRQLIEGGTVVMPGAFNAISAMLVEQAGFEAVYISGAGLANSAGLPDIGLLTLTEVVQQAKFIAEAVSIPCLCDADTGFGEAINVARAVKEFEGAGVVGIHIEDQEFPKRCGHLPGKRLVSVEAMVEKIQAAVEAKTAPDFLLIARTDARGVTGLNDAIRRAVRYIEAGADGVFPEALESKEEFAKFAEEVAPAFGERTPILLANMTEFGKTPYLNVRQFEEMGYRLVIFPMTVFRVMLKAVQEALQKLKADGTQKELLEQMVTRQELYDLLRYMA